MADTARAVEEPPEWERQDTMADSGASVTVISKELVGAVLACGARPDIRDEVADGGLIAKMGRETCTAITNDGVEHQITAQATDVSSKARESEQVAPYQTAQRAVQHNLQVEKRSLREGDDNVSL